jgi:ribosome biogenesis GTPase A
LWPKIEDAEGALKLAFGGAIPDTAIDYESVALYGAKVLLERYPELVKARYKLTDLPGAADALLVEIGKRRGGLEERGDGGSAQGGGCARA